MDAASFPFEPELDAEAILGGTLCLLCCAAKNSQPMYLEKAAANLALLASHPALSSQLRVVCRRLWASLESQVQPEAAPGNSRTASATPLEEVAPTRKLH